MIVIDPAQKSDREIYKLLIGSIIPRPIAFVTTLSPEGVLNAAPFSYFSIVSSNPPLLSIAVQRNKGSRKDTARNALEKGELVVHIVDEKLIAAVNQTAASLPPHESEVALAGLTPVVSDMISVPGVSEARIRMECELEQAIPLGGSAETPACDLLIARVVRFHFDEELYKEGHIDPIQLNPVSRMAGSYYSTLGKLFSIERPN
ncbi:flavin reductase family protein [Paenibacillus sp. GCM10027626]|uniref:flavin reductase family protein n=1 Tax=Paenibacillus sp. GCM10027626 TaxID=3273411 RepID=UPI0036401E31